MTNADAYISLARASRETRTEGVAADATPDYCGRDDALMDMFFLFAVIFLCVMFGLGIGALALSLLFKLILKISARASTVVVAAATASSSAPRA